MKNYYFIIVCILFASFSSTAQIDIDLKVDALKVIDLTPNIGVEVGMGSLGLEVTASYGVLNLFVPSTQISQGKPSVVDIFGNTILKGQDNVETFKSIRGISICVSPIWYFKPNYSLDGIRISPYVSYEMGQSDVYKGKILSVGGMIGKKRFFTERIGIEYTFGAGKDLISEKTFKSTGLKDYKLGDIAPQFKFLDNLKNINLSFNIKGIYRFGEGFQF